MLDENTLLVRIMADGGYGAKNGAREAPVHRVRGEGMSLGVHLSLFVVAFQAKIIAVFSG